MISIPALPQLPLDTTLYVGRAAFLVFSFALAATAFARLTRCTAQRAQDAERDARHTAAQLARALERLDEIEARIAANEPRLTVLAEQIETHLKPAATAASQNYAIAIRLARSGAQAADLVASCGLARQEAELVVRLHGAASERHTAVRHPERDARHVALMRA